MSEESTNGNTTLQASQAVSKRKTRVESQRGKD